LRLNRASFAGRPSQQRQGGGYTDFVIRFAKFGRIEFRVAMPKSSSDAVTPSNRRVAGIKIHA
jgi:hypothetical protein